MSESSKHSRLAEYFTLLADKIEIESKVGGLSAHRSDKGTIRERLVEHFLAKHLPRRLKPFLGGTVYGTDGAESSQIDVLVSSDIGVNFEEHEKMFVAVENLAAAISVKSYLNKATIVDSFDNLASIPQIDPRVLSFKLGDSQSFPTFISDHPSMFVFAYDGVSLETCTSHIQDYLNEHPNTPANRLPLAVIVNKEYFVKLEKKASLTRQGVQIAPNTILSVPLVRETQGYPFVQIVSAISAYADWLPLMNLRNDLYFRLAYGFPVPGQRE